MSIVESLKLIEKNAKRRRAKRGTDLQEVWHNCGLKVRAESGQTLYPLTIKRREEDYGYSLLLHLPHGLSDVSFRSRRHQLAWALGGDVEIEPVNGQLFLRVLTGAMPKRKDYHFADTGNMVMPVPIGYGREGLIMLDLADAPHLLLGGGSGAGKSNWLHQAIVTLLQANVSVYIIDLKRLEFAAYKKHAVCVFKEPESLEILQAVNREMERRMELLESAGVVKIQDYPGGLPYIAVVIDEISELQDDKAWTILNRLVRLARALGISVVAATQRPSTKVIDGDTRALFTARISFRVADKVNSQIILDGPQAAYLPTTPGRAIYRFGDRCREVQTMFLPVAQVREVLSTIPPRPPEPVQQPTIKPGG